MMLVKKTFIRKGKTIVKNDRVIVIDNGETYSTYDSLVQKLSLNFYCRGYTVPNGAIGHFEQIYNNDDKICHIRFVKSELLKLNHNSGYTKKHQRYYLRDHPFYYVDYLIGYRGIEYKEPAVHLPDDLFNINI